MEGTWKVVQGGGEMEGGGRYVCMCEEMCGELRLQNNFGTSESNLCK